MNKWKPQGYDEYYFWSIHCSALKTEWQFTNFDYLRWKLGNCFKTKEEAETKGRKIMRTIIREYEDE